jgi:transcriptional regulator with XRE-family HTH domain
MEYMQKVLRALMAANEMNARDLSEASGVPAPTTTRFLTGRHAEPKSATVRRWARAFNLTEGQLRGTEPIPGLDSESIEEKQLLLENVLTRDELSLVECMRSMDKDTRKAWLKISKTLSENTPMIRNGHPIHISEKKSEDNPLTGMKYRNIGNEGLQPEAKKA